MQNNNSTNPDDQPHQAPLAHRAKLKLHPHIHAIVPSAGLDAADCVVTVKNANFLVPQPVLQQLFRARFRDALADLTKEHPDLPAIDSAVWHKDWGIHLQSCGA